MRKYEAKNLETIQSVLEHIRALSKRDGYPYYSDFNGKRVFSTDTDDEAYKRVGLRSVEDFNVYKSLVGTQRLQGKDYISKVFAFGTDKEWHEVKEEFKEFIK